MNLSLLNLSAYLTVADGPADADDADHDALGLAHFMDALCDWVWELCLSLIAGRDSLSPDFITACRSTLQAQRRDLGRMPQLLLSKELDITGFANRLSRFDGLVADFERIAAALDLGSPQGDEPQA